MTNHGLPCKTIKKLLCKPALHLNVKNIIFAIYKSHKSKFGGKLSMNKKLVLPFYYIINIYYLSTDNILLMLQ